MEVCGGTEKPGRERAMGVPLGYDCMDGGDGVGDGRQARQMVLIIVDIDDPPRRGICEKSSKCCGSHCFVYVSFFSFFV